MGLDKLHLVPNYYTANYFARSQLAQHVKGDKDEVGLARNNGWIENQLHFLVIFKTSYLRK